MSRGESPDKDRYERGPVVFLDGAFVERDDARVSAFDAGIQHGVGLFETMTAGWGGDGPRVVHLVEHVERLSGSGGVLGLTERLETDALAEACLEAVRRSGLVAGPGERARVRLTVTGGDLNLLETSGRSNHRPTVMISVQPGTAYPEEMFDRGIALAVATSKANPLDPTAGHKTLNYWWRLRELQVAAARGAGEGLVLQVSNHVCGGCVSNVIAVHGDVAMTPIARGEEVENAVPSPVLPGVTRSAALGWLDEMGLEVKRQMMSIDDVLDADEVLMTNSSWGVLPVRQVEGKAIGEPGEVGRGLVERWRGVVG